MLLLELLGVTVSYCCGHYEFQADVRIVESYLASGTGRGKALAPGAPLLIHGVEVRHHVLEPDLGAEQA